MITLELATHFAFYIIEFTQDFFGEDVNIPSLMMKKLTFKKAKQCA